MPGSTSYVARAWAAGRGVEARARENNQERSRAPFLESQERAEQSGGVNPVALRKESVMT